MYPRDQELPFFLTICFANFIIHMSHNIKSRREARRKPTYILQELSLFLSSITVFLANGIIHKCQIGDAYFFNVKMFVWQDIHDSEPRRCEDEEQEETNPRVVHEEQGPVDSRILFLKVKVCCCRSFRPKKMSLYSLTALFASRRDQEPSSKQLSQ